MTQGDIVYMDFSPQAGHEQAGRRPGVIVSNDAFIARTGLALVCPITNTNKGYPLHVPLAGIKTTGVVMCEQLRSVDLRARNAKFFEKMPSDLFTQVLKRIHLFF